MVGLLGWLLFPKIPVWSDSLAYFTVARNLLMGKGLVSSYVGTAGAFIVGLPCPDMHMPGWPVLIAGFMWLTKIGPYSPIVLGIALTILSSFLVYFIVLFWSDTKRALAASVIFVFLPWVIAYEFTGMAEIAFLFWILLSLFFASIPNPKYRLVSILGSGLALLMGYVTRETALFFLPLVIAIMRMRGLSVWKLIVFGLVISLACLFSSYIYYSSYPGFREARKILALFGLFTKAGLLGIKHPITDIVTWNDIPQVSLRDLLWSVLIRKPIRIIFSIMKGESWYLILIRLSLVIPTILAPVMVRPRPQKIGLIFSALILAGMLTVYRGREVDIFTRIMGASATVALVFLIIWLRKSLSRWPYYALFVVSELVVGSGIYLDCWKGLIRSERLGTRLAEVLPKYLGPEPVVLGWGIHNDYAIHLIKRPDDVVVLYYDDLSDPNLIALRDRTGMSAFISYSSFSDSVRWGWREDTLVIEDEVMHLYTKPK